MTVVSTGVVMDTISCHVVALETDSHMTKVRYQHRRSVVVKYQTVRCKSLVCGVKIRLKRHLPRGHITFVTCST